MDKILQDKILQMECEKAEELRHENLYKASGNLDEEDFWRYRPEGLTELTEEQYETLDNRSGLMRVAVQWMDVIFDTVFVLVRSESKARQALDNHFVKSQSTVAFYQMVRVIPNHCTRQELLDLVPPGLCNPRLQKVVEEAGA